MDVSNNRFKFIDLFAGIGGFHLAMHKLGGECVFASEIDDYARKTYEHNHKKVSPALFEDGLFNDDIRAISPEEIPDFDVLCAGFPCQPFSQAGYKRGFDDNHKSERGNLFFNIVDILEAKRPRAFFLENVRGIVNHDGGKTFRIIREILEDELGYSFYFKVVKASDYGLPQLRPRAFMIGFRDEGLMRGFDFPPSIPLKFNMSDVWGGECSREIGFTIRVGGRGSRIDDRRNWDSYLVNGEVRRLMPEQGILMQGFPTDFEFPVPKVQAMKQLGNSVAVDAIYACGKALLEYSENLVTDGSSMNNKSNKGEWSELYSLLKLIHDRKITLADSDMNPIYGDLTVTKAATLNSPNEYILTDSDEICINPKNGNASFSLPVKDILNEEILADLVDRIQAGSGTFEIGEFEVIKSKLGLIATKGGNPNQKADALVSFTDGSKEYTHEGFGIKSYLGGDPTLLNASGSNTNFVFKVENLNDLSLEHINSIEGHSKIKKRLEAILKYGGRLNFDRVESSTMEGNLKKVDATMPELLAQMLLKFFIKRKNDIVCNVAAIHNDAELIDNPCYADMDTLQIRVKRLLHAALLGFFTGKPWDGNRCANGTLVIKNDGSQIGYHIVKQNVLDQYLYDHIRFDTPSTTRHRFGKLFVEKDGQKYFKLNLQLRF